MLCNCYCFCKSLWHGKKAIFMDTVIEIIIEIIAEITELIVDVFKSKYRKKRPGKEKKMMHGENHE